jgi:hypothetical protein
MHRKPHFIAISVMGTRQQYAPENYIHGQGVFKTMIQFPNHQDDMLEALQQLQTRSQDIFGHNPHADILI